MKKLKLYKIWFSKLKTNRKKTQIAKTAGFQNAHMLMVDKVQIWENVRQIVHLDKSLRVDLIMIAHRKRNDWPKLVSKNLSYVPPNQYLLLF